MDNQEASNHDELKWCGLIFVFLSRQIDVYTGTCAWSNHDELKLCGPIFVILSRQIDVYTGISAWSKMETG